MVIAPDPKTQALVYARFSPRANPEESASIENQNDICTRYCEQRGYEIAGMFADPERSGGGKGHALDPAEELDRQGLMDMLNEVKRGFVVVAYRPDRLARDVYLDEYIHRLVRSKGGRVECVEAGVVGDGADAQLMRKILAAFAEYERKVIAARTKAAMRRRQGRGQYMGGPEPPFGYAKRGKALVRDVREQIIVDYIVELYKELGSFRGVARRLKDEGVRCRGRVGWLHGTVKRIIERKEEMAI